MAGEILLLLKPCGNQPMTTEFTGGNLKAAQAAARRYRGIQLTIQNLEEQLAQAKRELRTMQFETLPDILDQAGVDQVGVPADGNQPAFDIKLTPFFQANIASDWPREKRDAAFQKLTDMGYGELIKTEINVTVPRHERQTALRIIAALEHFPVTPEIKESVHHKTLTAWLQEAFENNRELPPLDVIGAVISRIAKLKERR